MTTQQIRNQTKTVTRRFGWWFLVPGSVVQPVEKAMGLKKGESVIEIGPPIQVVSTRGEPLNAITDEDCILEGFPNLTPSEFVEMLVRHYKCNPAKEINRIEFKYTEVLLCPPNAD